MCVGVKDKKHRKHVVCFLCCFFSGDFADMFYLLFVV